MSKNTDLKRLTFLRQSNAWSVILPRSNETDSPQLLLDEDPVFDGKSNETTFVLLLFVDRFDSFSVEGVGDSSSSGSSGSDEVVIAVARSFTHSRRHAV